MGGKGGLVVVGGMGVRRGRCGREAGGLKVVMVGLGSGVGRGIGGEAALVGRCVAVSRGGGLLGVRDVILYRDGGVEGLVGVDVEVKGEVGVGRRGRLRLLNGVH